MLIQHTFVSNSETLIDPNLVTDSMHVIDSDAMPIDRSISDHDGTYVAIHSGYDHNNFFTIGITSVLIMIL